MRWCLPATSPIMSCSWTQGRSPSTGRPRRSWCARRTRGPGRFSPAFTMRGPCAPPTDRFAATFVYALAADRKKPVTEDRDGLQVTLVAGTPSQHSLDQIKLVAGAGSQHCLDEIKLVAGPRNQL